MTNLRKQADMSNVLCAICGESLPPQKAGMPRTVHAGECTKARARINGHLSYEERKLTAEGRAKLKDQRSRAFKKWRESHPDYNAKRLAEWRNANRDRMAESNLAYCRANADKVREKNLRRRARLMGAFVEDVDLTGLWERDKGACGICGNAVDPALPWPDKMSKTLDHIVPLSRDGKHSWANSQLAHAVCNSRKNNKTTAELQGVSAIR